MSTGMELLLTSHLWIAVVSIFAMFWRHRYAGQAQFWLLMIGAALIPCVLAFIASFFPAKIPVFFADIKPAILTQQASQIIHEIKTRDWLEMGYNFYVILALGFCVRTLWQWGGLQILAKKSVCLAADVHVTDADIPPLALGWPKRSVLHSKAVLDLPHEQYQQILSHERAHLQNGDPEKTLILIILKNILWINPGFSWLVSKWRLAAELEADRAVVQSQPQDFRRAYAKLLISALDEKKRGGALPCPSAHLNSNNLRSVKMRLNTILTSDETVGKVNSVKRLGPAAAILTLLGGAALTVVAAEPILSMDEPQLKSRGAPPVFPASCPGLTVKILADEISRDREGNITDAKNYTVVGKVKIKFDVTKAGNVENVSILDSAHECFNAPTVNAAQSWKYEATDKGYEGIQARVDYRLTADPEDSRTEAEQLMEQIGLLIKME